jgi:hypothetical protein
MSIRFLGSSPPPGSTITVEECDGGCTNGLTLRFSVVSESSLPEGVSLLVELLDRGGRVCAFDTARATGLRAGQTLVVQSGFLVLSDGSGAGNFCPFPIETSMLKVTLISDETGRTHDVERTFHVPYTFAARPASPRPTTPQITELDWDALGPTGYHACPLPDEVVSVACAVDDQDGDGLTVTLTLENRGNGSLGAGPTTFSKTFPPSPYTRRLSGSFTMAELTTVLATCRAADSRGLSATPRSIAIPCGSE